MICHNFLTFKSLDEILYGVTIQIKLLLQNFCMVLFYFLETFKKKFGGMCVTKLVFITHPVISDVQLYRSLSYFPNIVVTFLHSQSSKTKSRLSTTPCKPRKNTQSRLCYHLHQSKRPPANADIFSFSIGQ